MTRCNQPVPVRQTELVGINSNFVAIDLWIPLAVVRATEREAHHRGSLYDPRVTADYEAWHAERERAEEQRADAIWHRSTLAHLPEDLTGRRTLEIGCARGLFAKLLAERGANVVAADFSPTAVEYARRRLDGMAEVLLADVQDIPFPDESFDLTISQETLEHVPDPLKGMAELVRVTKRDGTLIITGPNYFNMLGLYRIALRLVGRRFTEVGQPINQPLMLLTQARRLAKLGCRLNAVEGWGVPLVVPRLNTYYLPARPRWLAKWLAYETTLVATRLSSGALDVKR